MPIVLNGTVGIDTPTLTGLTTPLTVSVGGTGAATLTSGSVLVGAGTSAVTGVAPSTSGNVLTSNGTAWTSAALPAGGVTSLNGQTGAITDTTLYAIGSYVNGRPLNGTNYPVNTTLAGSSLYSIVSGGGVISAAWYNPITSSLNSGNTLVNTGTWRVVSPATGNGSEGISGLWVRIS